MIESLGAFGQFCNYGVITGIAFIAVLVVQFAKRRKPTIQGSATVVLVFVVAIVLAVLAQGAFWQAGQAQPIWSFAGALGIILNAFLGGCGAIGMDVAKNAAMKRDV